MLLAHKFIAQLQAQRGKTCDIGVVSVDFIPEHVDDIIRKIDGSVKFYCGEYGDIKATTIHPDLVRLPFSSIYCEFSAHGIDSGACRFCAICFEDNGRILCGVFQMTHAVLPCASIMLFPDQAGGVTMRVNSYPGVRIAPGYMDSINNDAQIFGANLAAFLQAINCSNVGAKDHHPPEKLNRKRIKNGKVPRYSYKTLYLYPEAHKSSAANPDDAGELERNQVRLHLRRGHVRQYRPGLFTWVQPCVVGNKTRGIVMKDYALAPKKEKENDNP